MSQAKSHSQNQARTRTKRSTKPKTPQFLEDDDCFRLDEIRGADYINQAWFKNASHLESWFAQRWVELYPKLDLWTEQQLIKGRKFRYDFVHYGSKVAIEIQGGTNVAHTGHTSPKGIQRDIEKVRLASAQGWQVIAVSAADLEDDRTFHDIAKAIQSRLT